MAGTMENKNGVCRITLSRGLTIETAEELYGLFTSAVSGTDEEHSSIVLNDGGIEKIDLTGLQLLMALKNSAEQSEIPYDPGEVVKNVRIKEGAALLGIGLEYLKSR